MSSIRPEGTARAGSTRVIAHRGASGYLPEHTLPAKALAYGLGCDFIEQDVVATADGVPIVLHDVWLDDVSDVAGHYPERRRDDGRFYVVDFTRDELTRLRLEERREPGSTVQRFPGRFPYASDGFRIVDLADEIRLISGLNASTGRHVGLYPEIKSPAWHADAGIDLTRIVHETLAGNRNIISGPVFVQSFDSEALIRLRDEFRSDWPRLQLLDDDAVAAIAVEPDYFERVATYAVGVGLPYVSLIDAGAGDGRLRASPLVDRIAEAGLVVHPYTLRRDVAPPDGLGYEAALRFLLHELEVDAIFCDHPDDAIRLRDGSAT